MNDAPASGDPQRAGRPDRSPAAADVAGTLSDLERKLRELEIELSSVRRPAGRQPAAAPSPPPPPPPEPDPDPPPVPEEPPPAPEPEARLVDEGLAAPEPPPPPPPAPIPPPPPRPEPPPPVGEFARSPAAPPPPPSGPPAELVAEVRERIAGVEAQLEDLMRLRREIELRAHALETGAAPATAATPPPPPPPPPIHTQPPRTPPEPAEAMFEGPVVLEVGPLPDIATVAELELKLTRLAEVISAHVRSYAGQRAVVDLQLAAPTPLTRHLRDALGAELSVLDSASGRLSVVVETGAGLGPRL